ncbi:DUF881 domain-containing protein [Jiangella sp. DSM 45060]|uniref:DUF881 domain-containing protein n=1 Tax=Jiangella sp. DSM 45060 TaxID=1798224 RepID=UPI00087A2978|nr:DUF881 domain-containing protein [Jiangella sp. DSM 45060]SDT69104.1 Uncharacterized conserved protein YlxW, UPF0749 family [Jiangella sp. DSM 45060]
MNTISRPSDYPRVWRFLAPLVLAGCGVLLITSAKAADGEDLRGSDVVAFSDLVRAEEQRVQELQARIDDLSSDIDDLTAGQGDGKSAEIDRHTEEIMPAAGLTAVQGPGLTVTLDDADLPNNLGEDSPFNTEDYLVHQQDLEGVINALWAGGAEALTVMDQRIIWTSTVQCEGPVLLLNGRTFYPPYTISAIGDADAMRRALDNEPKVREYRAWADRIGLFYGVTDDDNIAMPAFEGSVQGGRRS